MRIVELLTFNSLNHFLHMVWQTLSKNTDRKILTWGADRKNITLMKQSFRYAVTNVLTIHITCFACLFQSLSENSWSSYSKLTGREGSLIAILLIINLRHRLRRGWSLVRYETPSLQFLALFVAHNMCSWTLVTHATNHPSWLGPSQ